MKPVPLSRIAQWTGGTLRGADASRDRLVDMVVTDTRVLQDGRNDIACSALFVAIKGARFDGHDHVREAGELGARAALVSTACDTAIPQVVVADTERALASLAATMQRTRNTKVVAITGSNGKTSVKTLLLSILGRAGRAYANPGNFNNEIGLPLAVIDAPDDAQFAIYEMGAGKPGDIAYLTAIVRPDVALVNNIAPAHLERLGDLQGVADTKAAIYDALPRDGIAVINADDDFATLFAARAQGRTVLRFGFGADAEVRATDVRLADDCTHVRLVTPQGEAEALVPMSGRHNVANALAATALALACGVPLDVIVAGLREAKPVAGRLVRHRLGNGAVLVDDSYNANPGSLDAAIDTLAATGGENWLVLGDMRELGADAEALHAEAGRRAKAAGIARLYALGPLSAAAARAFGSGAQVFDSHASLAQALRSELHGTVRVLVKGSRGSAMDRIVEALLGAPPETGDTAHAA